MSSRKRARAATTPITEPAPAKLAITGGVAMPEKTVNIWRQGKALDAVATAGGVEFGAHRLVLMSGSDFFEGAFSSGMAEADSAHVTLAEVPSCAFEAVLSFMYTGEATVREEDLPALLSSGAFLQISSLVDAVAARLEARLTPPSCLEVWALAETHGLEQLAAAAKETALREFEAAAASASWVVASRSRVHELLSDERLTTAAEEAVHQAVVRWASAQRPPPTDAELLPLFRHVRYPLVAKAFFEQSVVNEPLLCRTPLGFDVLSSGHYAAAVFSPPVLRRPGFDPSRLSMTWSTERKGSNVTVTEDGKLARGRVAGGSGRLACVCSAELLPTTGKHLVEVVHMWDGTEAGSSLGGGIMTGVVSSGPHDFGSMTLAHLSHGFWGMDDNGSGGEVFGIRRGAGGTEAVPPEAKTADEANGKRVFMNGDRIGLLVDMDAHTLTFLRNGAPIPIVFHNLPEQLYVAATVYADQWTVRLVD